MALLIASLVVVGFVVHWVYNGGKFSLYWYDCTMPERFLVRGRSGPPSSQH